MLYRTVQKHPGGTYVLTWFKSPHLPAILIAMEPR
jgi:hypothetical protein